MQYQPDNENIVPEKPVGTGCEKNVSVADSSKQGKPGVACRITVDSEACLEGATETQKAVVRQKLTVSNPKYQAARRYSRWVGKKLKPRLFFFTSTGSGYFSPAALSIRLFSFAGKLLGLLLKYSTTAAVLPRWT